MAVSPNLSNAERGKAFQILCRDALQLATGRAFDLEVPIEIGGGKRHFFDLATIERDIVVECKELLSLPLEGFRPPRSRLFGKRRCTSDPYGETLCAFS